MRYLVERPRFVAQLEVGAVAVSHRSPEPPYRGDEILRVALAEARATMKDGLCSSGLLAGFIIVENRASMRMARRNELGAVERSGGGRVCAMGAGGGVIRG